MFIPVGFIFGAPVFGWASNEIFRRRVDTLLCLLLILIGAWITMLLSFSFITTGEMIFL
jgi:biotin transporter BioY